MPNKIAPKVINLGCRLNFFESELIKGILSQEKHDEKIVVNTCAVTNLAVRKSVQEIQKLSKLFPDKEIFVTGCASQVDKNLFTNSIVISVTLAPSSLKIHNESKQKQNETKRKKKRMTSLEIYLNKNEIF